MEVMALLVRPIFLVVLGTVYFFAGRRFQGLVPTWIRVVVQASGLTWILTGYVTLGSYIFWVQDLVFTDEGWLLQAYVLISGSLSVVKGFLALLFGVAMLALVRHLRDLKEQLEIYEERA